MADKKRLIMISQRYPYGAGEVYLERELKFFSKYFDSVLLYPLQKLESKRAIPENVELNNLFCNRTHKVNKVFALKKWKSANRIINEEIENTVSGSEYLKIHKKDFLAQLFMNYELADSFYDSFHQDSDDFETSFYSVWLDEGAVMMSLLKRAGKINSFALRLHGYDLYDDRREGQYMPFRNLCFKEASRVFVVSETGADYTRQLNVFPEKVIANYSGLYDHGMTKPKDDEFHIVSCSNLVGLKRVDQVVGILKDLKVAIKWTHFGDGVEMEKIQSLASTLPDNIKYELKGHVNYEDLIQYYSDNHVSLFIHLSASEGLPLAIVEAMSFGIPAIACDVGGVAEVVSEKEGFLISKEIDISLIQSQIIELFEDETLRLKLAEGAREKFLEKFEAEKNYTFFTNQLIKA